MSVPARVGDVTNRPRIPFRERPLSQHHTSPFDGTRYTGPVDLIHGDAGPLRESDGDAVLFADSRLSVPISAPAQKRVRS